MSPDSHDMSQSPTDPEVKRSLWSRIPRHLLGGRVRTTTAVMVLLFVGLLALYGQRVDHYAQIDADRAAASTAPRTTPSTTEEYVPEATTTRRSTSSSVPSSTSVTPTTTGTDDGSTDTETAPTTTTGGGPFPNIPGFQLPGQTPTTTPAR
jgi:cytoskeletal protein RodZ